MKFDPAKFDDVACSVCGEACPLLDVVDFNKSCEERRGKRLRLAGVPVYYALCNNCGFCFAPELYAWSLEEFEARIYNDQYVLVDPDYVEARPKASAATLLSAFSGQAPAIKHLDYGGGNGLLARLLRDADWNSTSYDPFVDRGADVAALGKFDLITAFEVFEHVPNVQELIANLRTLLSPDGLILFSTLLTDGNITANQRLNWWYASPRNGHISLFSRKSLEIVARTNNWNFGSFSPGLHTFFASVPPWAAHILRTG